MLEVKLEQLQRLVRAKAIVDLDPWLPLNSLMSGRVKHMADLVQADGSIRISCF